MVMFGEKTITKIKKQWDFIKGSGCGDNYPLSPSVVAGVEYLISLVKDQRLELALHKDIDLIDQDCPGCYMEYIWEGEIKELKETIKLLRKKYKISATVLKSLRK